MTVVIPVGIVIILAGLALLVTGIRHHGEQNPRHVAMLIGGMMMTAFGLIIAGFAYQGAAPLDLNASSVAAR